LKYLVLRESGQQILTAIPWDDLDKKREVFAKELLDAIEASAEESGSQRLSLTVEVGEIPLELTRIPDNEINLCQIHHEGEEVTSLQIAPSDIREELEKGAEVYGYVGGLWRRIVE
jgi:hypothetical protein